MSDGFTHEYEASTDEEAAEVEVEKPKRGRTPKQQAATAKALEALSKRREEAAAARASKKPAAKLEAAKPTPVAAAPPPAAAGAGASPPNPLAHAVDAKPAYDPLMIAEIVKREIELQKAKERELGWHKTRKSSRSRSRRRARSESSSDDDSDETEESYDDRPSRVLQRRARKPAKIVPDARDAASAPPTDFFDQLMTRHSKFNPW